MNPIRFGQVYTLQGYGSATRAGAEQIAKICGKKGVDALTIRSAAGDFFVVTGDERQEVQALKAQIATDQCVIQDGDVSFDAASNLMNSTDALKMAIERLTARKGSPVLNLETDGTLTTRQQDIETCSEAVHLTTV